MAHDPILVPLDGSAQAETALPAATTLASIEERPIELLAVVEPMAGFPDTPRLGPLVADGLRVRLHGIAEHLRASGLLVETAIRSGYPAEAILAYAEERPAHLVVMTTRGMGGLERWLVGSVADKVLRLAPCPVVLLPPGTGDEGHGERWQPKRLLVPLDGSDLAEQALPLAARWAMKLDAELLLVRVQPWSAVQFAMVGGYVPDLGELDEQAAQAAAEYLEECRRRVPASVVVHLRVLRGDPAGCLLDCVEQDKVDFTIMTSRGRGGVRRLVLGSVADRLVRGRLPICIVHPAPSAPESTETAT